MADGVQAWISLKEDLTTNDYDLHTYFEKQFKRALKPVAIAAYMLHPKYRGQP